MVSNPKLGTCWIILSTTVYYIICKFSGCERI